MSKFLANLGSYMVRYQYLILAAMLLYKIVIDATYGTLFGDFWEHSAVVTELLRRPLNPSHPILPIEAPHVFISPYAYLVAGVAAIFRISPIDTLVLFGILNCCLFIHALKFFVAKLCGAIDSRTTNVATFLALLLILFLWGFAPWGYSGFFYFNNLSLVLPYPSTFALILSFYAMGLGFGLKQAKNLTSLGIIYFICVFVLLSHPLTFISLALCLIAQPCTFEKPILPLSQVIFLLGLSVITAILWPHYPLAELATGSGDVFHHSNSDMYNHVASRTWPTLMMLPFVFWAFKDANGRAILLTIAGLCAIYAFGYFTQKYSFGRVIAIILLLVQISISIGIARSLAYLLTLRPYLRTFAPIATLVILIAFCSQWAYPIFFRSLTVANNLASGRPLSMQLLYGNLTFISDYLQPNDVVLSDIQTSWLIPSFGGKVIAALHPIAFVIDHTKRADDLIKFFNLDSTPQKRIEIRNKYQARYLLLNKLTQPNWKVISEEFSKPNAGDVVFENAQFQLIALTPTKD